MRSGSQVDGERGALELFEEGDRKLQYVGPSLAARTVVSHARSAKGAEDTCYPRLFATAKGRCRYLTTRAEVDVECRAKVTRPAAARRRGPDAKVLDSLVDDREPRGYRSRACKSQRDPLGARTLRLWNAGCRQCARGRPNYESVRMTDRDQWRIHAQVERSIAWRIHRVPMGSSVRHATRQGQHDRLARPFFLRSRPHQSRSA